MNEDLLNLISQLLPLWYWLVAHPDQVKVATALATAAWSFITLGLALRRITRIAKAASAIADRAAGPVAHGHRDDTPAPDKQTPPTDTDTSNAGEVDASREDTHDDGARAI
jgi:hypothetical protein